MPQPRVPGKRGSLPPEQLPSLVCCSARDRWPLANCSPAQHVQNASCRLSRAGGSPFGALLSEATATDVLRKGKSLCFIQLSSPFSQDHMVSIAGLYTSHPADDEMWGIKCRVELPLTSM